jgi:hypothetical protein
MTMGFPRDKAIAALSRTKHDVDRAADILVGGGTAQDKAWMAGGVLEDDEEVARRVQQESAGQGPRYIFSKVHYVLTFIIDFTQ